MRQRGQMWAGIFVALFTMGCAVENPTYLAVSDGEPPSTTDAGIVQPPTPDSNWVTPDSEPQPLCTPGSFIGCAGPVKLERCNETGFDTETLACPMGCNVKAERCNDCVPTKNPACNGNFQVSCNPRGFQVKVPCPYGCFGGQCKGCTLKTYYPDQDADGFGDGKSPQPACAQPSNFVLNNQDCNDSSNEVYPKQEHFFKDAMPGTKSYDYNCDKKEERQLKEISLVNCSKVSGSCKGSGWVLIVPKCGKSGLYINCVSTPGSSTCSPFPGTATQRCR